MATAAQMRKLALALPEAEEKSHFEKPDFRVRTRSSAASAALVAPKTLVRGKPRQAVKKNKRD